MNAADKAIGDILARYGEPFAGNVWRVQGTAVIYHKALERIAAQVGIRFDEPKIIRAERDEAVTMVVGRLAVAGSKPERVEWSFGEAVIGMNYRVSGKQAAYPWAMAEKRAKDRVILKLIELSGLVYSEEEADEFKKGNADRPGGSPDDGSPQAIERALRGRINAARTVEAVTDLMTQPEVQQDLASLAPGIRDAVRDHAKGRMITLGWVPPRRKAP